MIYKLLELQKYLARTRGVGHTTSMIKGAENSDCIVLAHSEEGVECIKSTGYDGEVIGINQIKEGVLNLDRKPLLFDNATVRSILCIALDEINKRDQRIERMKNLARRMDEV